MRILGTEHRQPSMRVSMRTYHGGTTAQTMQCKDAVQLRFALQ